MGIIVTIPYQVCTRYVQLKYTAVHHPICGFNPVTAIFPLHLSRRAASHLEAQVL